MAGERAWLPMGALVDNHGPVWIAGKFGEVWVTGGTYRKHDAEFGRIGWICIVIVRINRYPRYTFWGIRIANPLYFGIDMFYIRAMVADKHNYSCHFSF